MLEMNFYVVKTEEGIYHVQNAVMGMLGQHHVHTERGYNRWRKGVPVKNIHLSAGECDCGLSPGTVRSHTGDVSYNPKFK